MPERDYYNELFSESSSELLNRKYNSADADDNKLHLYPVKVYDEKKCRIVEKNIKCYLSGDVGNAIRNAQYGTYYKYYISQTSGGSYVNDNYISDTSSKKQISHNIGSRYEELYFKIKMPSIVSNTGEKKSVTLFYNNPGQCERHLNLNFSMETKNAWNKKRMAILLDYKYKCIFEGELAAIRPINEHEGQNVVVK